MGRFVERLTTRWVTLVRGLLRIAEAFGIAPVETFFVTDEEPIIGRGLYRGREVVLKLRGAGDLLLAVASVSDVSGSAWTLARGESDVLEASGDPPAAMRAVVGAAPAVLLGVRHTGTCIETVFDAQEAPPSELASAFAAIIDAGAALATYR